jgi:hypothetical protein
MDDTRKVQRMIEPLDEADLETDLKFLYHNRTDTVDQFIDEAIPVIKYHVNQVMTTYQDRLLEELTDYMRGEIAGVILRVRRETVHPKKQEADGGHHAW